MLKFTAIMPSVLMLMMAWLCACGNLNQKGTRITLGSTPADNAPSATPGDTPQINNSSNNSAGTQSTSTTTAGGSTDSGGSTTGSGRAGLKLIGGLTQPAFSVVTSSNILTSLKSPNGAYTLVMQSDGNLVEFHYGTSVWSSKTAGMGGGAYQAVVSTDGNFIVYAGTTALWSSGTAGKGTGPNQLTVQNDGNVVLYDANNVPLWTTAVTSNEADVPLMPRGSALSASANIVQLSSPNEAYTLVMQADGNLVESHNGQSIWASGTAGQGAAPYSAVMQSDGNLVVYDSTSKVLWSTGTSGQGTAPFSVTLNNYGNVVVSDATSTIIWTSIGSPGTQLTGAAWTVPVASTIVNQGSANSCLDTNGSNTGVPSIIQGCQAGRLNQGWVYTLDQELQSAWNNGVCLTFENQGQKVSVVDMQPCNASTAQHWVLTAADNAYGTIQPVENGAFCLDTSGANVQVDACNGSKAQQWSKIPTGTVSMYNPSAPLWPASYTDANTQAAQRAAYDKVLSNFNAALAAHATQFTVPPGIYRNNGQSLYMYGYGNLTLNLAGVEIISENGAPAIYPYGNHGTLTVNGPAILDFDAPYWTQGVVVGSDQKSYLDVRIQDGYPAFPAGTLATKFQMFGANGLAFPTWETETKNTAPTDMGGGVLRFAVNANVFYKPNSQTVNPAYGVAGDYIVLYLAFPNSWPNIPANIHLICNTGAININQITFYGGAIDGWVQGPVNLWQVKGKIRPGTNRLWGGNNSLFPTVNGGSFSIDESEFGFNTDDTTDLFSMAFTANDDNPQQGVGANQFYAYTIWNPYAVNTPIQIWDANMNLAYNATITGLTNQGNGNYLFTVDQNVTVQHGYSITSHQADSLLYRFTDTYVHDGQNNGIEAEGGNLFTATNNVTARIAVDSITDNFFGGGPQGGVAQTVIMNNNTIIDGGYNNTDGGGHAAFEYVQAPMNGNPSGKPIQSVTIHNNLSQYSPAFLAIGGGRYYGVAAGQAQTVDIAGNVKQ